MRHLPRASRASHSSAPDGGTTTAKDPRLSPASVNECECALKHLPMSDIKTNFSRQEGARNGRCEGSNADRARRGSLGHQEHSTIGYKSRLLKKKKIEWIERCLIDRRPNV